MGKEINANSMQPIAEAPAGMLTFMVGSLDCGSAGQRNKQVLPSTKCRINTQISKYISNIIDLPTVTLLGVGEI